MSYKPNSKNYIKKYSKKLIYPKHLLLVYVYYLQFVIIKVNLFDYIKFLTGSILIIDVAHMDQLKVPSTKLRDMINNNVRFFVASDGSSYLQLHQEEISIQKNKSDPRIASPLIYSNLLPCSPYTKSLWREIKLTG